LIFAKIDFINLLPFYIYIKKNIRSSQTKAIINYKKSYPSKINKDFKKRKIDSAFISSIKSQNKKCTNIGIVAKKDVLSVLSINGEYNKDIQSDTSNILAQVLNCNGKIIIGDKALKYYYENKNKDFIDLAEEWNIRYNLPFVFARLCFNKNGKIITEIAKEFTKNKVKIPQYILKRYSKKTNISTANILNYLDKISYDINYKEEKSLKKFLKLSKKATSKEIKSTDAAS
jgi:chorismate dehydratase